MLIPLKKEAISDLIPPMATGNQYIYYWSNLQVLLRNFFISFVGVLIFWLIGIVLGKGAEGLSLILRVTAGLYWLWNPIYWASVKNAKLRRYNYSGYWRGRVLDIYLTEELVNEESAIDKLGRLIIVENTQKKFNIEIGDKSGFYATITTPLQRIYKSIKVGDHVEGLLLSNDPDLMRISQITDVFLPRHKLWLGDYPYLRRDLFLNIRRELIKIYG